jgi:hypothetical protein
MAPFSLRSHFGLVAAASVERAPIRSSVQRVKGRIGPFFVLGVSPVVYTGRPMEGLKICITQSAGWKRATNPSPKSKETDNGVDAFTA